MRRGTTDTAKDIFELIRDSPKPLLRKEIAEKLKVSLPTVSRYTTGQYAGRYVTLNGRYLTLKTQAANALTFTFHDRPENRQLIGQVFTADPPLIKLITNGIEKAQADLNTGQRPKTLTAKQLNALLATLEDFSVEILRFIEQTKNQPNYGTNEWWIDYCG